MRWAFEEWSERLKNEVATSQCMKCWDDHCFTQCYIVGDENRSWVRLAVPDTYDVAIFDVLSERFHKWEIWSDVLKKKALCQTWWGEFCSFVLSVWWILWDIKISIDAHVPLWNVCAPVYTSTETSPLGVSRKCTFYHRNTSQMKNTIVSIAWKQKHRQTNTYVVCIASTQRKKKATCNIRTLKTRFTCL
jgi:hypothetical protein